MFWKKKLTKVFAPVLQKPVLQEIVDELKHQDRFIQMFVNRCDQKLDQMKMIIDSAQVTSVKNSERLETILALLGGRTPSAVSTIFSLKKVASKKTVSKNKRKK